MKKGAFSTIIFILLFLVGLSLLLYPTLSDWWNSFHSTRAISTYQGQVSSLDNDHYAQFLEAAQAYNRSLMDKADRFTPDDEALATYNSLLSVSATGILGYIEIPAIDCSLPIYHGADEAVLQVAIGHIPGSSLPVGGESTHCVLSGHRGLPSAKLFTDLDKLCCGDTFQLRVLDETLTYEIDQILTVLPQEVEALDIDEGQDYCTLVTCTPYGINTHRLLVRGHRIEAPQRSISVHISADAVLVPPLTVGSVLMAPLLLIMLTLLLVPTRRKR